MVLLIDNYDSFTFNLYQYIGNTTEDIDVIRNDKIDINMINKEKYSHIVISPGPGRPENAGSCIEIIKKFYNKIPILGVCLGCQAVGYAFGGEIIHAKELYHGKTDTIYKNRESRIFTGIKNSFIAARYHSLVINHKKVPENLIITSKSNDGEIMSVEHKTYPVFGVQFHPESIATPDGLKIIENFLSI